MNKFFETYYVIFLKMLARLVVPKNKYAVIFEMESKRSQGKLGGGNSITTEAACAIDLLKLSKDVDILFFDIGANEGIYTAEIRKLLKNVKVVAFEPSEVAFGILSQNFSSNSDIKLVNLALSDFAGEATLYANKGGSGLGSLSSRDLRHLGIDFEHQETIQVSTAESWIDQNGEIPDFVKIDVEGHELATLKGFGPYLKQIKLIQFELGGCNIDTKTYFKDFWNLLSPNFLIFRITPHGPDPVPNYTENDESFMTQNLLGLNKNYLKS